MHERCIADKTPAGEAPLRLNDVTCRYRQRPRPKKYKACKTAPDLQQQDADAAGDKVAFPFHVSGYPCQKTITRYYVDTSQMTTTTTLLQNPVPRTPFIDELAKGGALFTRAYVSGNACKTSRSTMTFGKHHRHNDWFNGLLAGAPPPDPFGRFLVDEYQRYLIGKGEIVNADPDGGYDAGYVRSGPKPGRFDCGDGTLVNKHCDKAVKDDPPNPPKVPRIAREWNEVGSVGDLFDAVYGEGRFDDQGVISTGDPVSGLQTSHLTRRFFLWFATKVPHSGGSYAQQMRDTLYGGHGPNTQKISRACRRWTSPSNIVTSHARASALDGTNAEALLRPHGDHLRPTGFHLEAKECQGTRTHGAHHVCRGTARAGRAVHAAVPPRVEEDQLVHSIDLLQTAMAYAGAGEPWGATGVGDTEAYRFGRNLKAHLAGGSGDVRQVLYGEKADSGGAQFGADGTEGRLFYMIPKPGEVKFCSATRTPAPYDYPEAMHDRDCWPTAW
jgi:hypothetical protein